MIPRVVSLDLDGTLLHSDMTVSPRTVATLRRCAERGIRLVVASARPARSIRALVPPDVPLTAWVCYNGAETYENGELVLEQTLAPEVVRALLTVILRYAPDAMIALETRGLMFANRILEHPWEHKVVDLARIAERPVAKMLFDAERIADLDAFRTEICDTCAFTLTDAGRLGHLMAPGVSKARALEALVARWDASMANVVAFGDDLNDLDILRESGLGVAMGNALPEVKRAADTETLTNDEDGVAVTLESLLARLE